MGKDVPNFFYFFVSFVTVIYTPIRIHHYSCYIVLDTEMQALSLKLLCYIYSDRYMRKDVPNFWGTFFVLFRYSDLCTHHNPSLLLLHSAGLRDACIIMETPFVTFVPIVTQEKMSQFFFTFSRSFVMLHYIPLRLLLRYGRN